MGNVKVQKPVSRLALGLFPSYLAPFFIFLSTRGGRADEHFCFCNALTTDSGFLKPLMIRKSNDSKSVRKSGHQFNLKLGFPGLLDF